jgi:hypothetical protein
MALGPQRDPLLRGVRRLVPLLHCALPASLTLMTSRGVAGDQQ